MSEDYVEVPPDSTGKKLRALKKNVGGNDVYDEVVAVEDGSGNIVDVRQIRALTAADIVSAVKSGLWNIDNLLNPHPIIVQTSSGTGFLIIDSNGRIGINNFPSDYFKSGQNIGNTSFKIVDSAGTALLVVDSNGRIGINNFPASFKVLDSAGTSFLVVDSSGKIGINSLPNVTVGSALPTGSNTIGSVKIVDSAGTALLVIDSSGRITDVPVQTTRTNLTVKPEREDLLVIGATPSPSNAGVLVITGTGGAKIKVFAAGYEILAAGLHYFYYGTSTTSPGVGAKTFLLGSAVGRNRQTFTNPVNSGSTGDNLYIFSAVSETSMPVDVQYVIE